MKYLNFSLIAVILTTLQFFSFSASQAQDKANLFDQENTRNFNKIYVHTDREFYFEGDSVWFKVYYLNSRTHKLINGAMNVYVNLINAKGLIVENQVLPLENGIATGCMNLNKLDEYGNYLFRVYTNNQISKGDDTFFHKTIVVSEIKDSSELQKDSIINPKTPLKVDLAILAEGGPLLEGKMNIIGIKATDSNGNALNISGRIIDGNKQTVSTFNTIYKGLGKAYFFPKQGESYNIFIDEYPDQEFDLGEITKQGIKLNIKKQTDAEIIFQTISNSKALNGPYYFAIMNRGKVYHYEKIIKKEDDVQIRIKKLSLPAGINRFVLLNDDLVPLSERLYFSKNIKQNNILIQTDKEKYESRSEVKLTLTEELKWMYTSNSNLSITVVDEGAFGEYGFSTNMLSHLLINSELKGPIQQAADFFIDEENLSSDHKLSLLMLTHGWSKYIRNTLSESGQKQTPSEGFSIQGKVKKLLSSKPVINGSITVGLFQNNYLLNTFETITDSTGKFRIDGLKFRDSATIFVQALNKKGKSYTEILMDSVITKSPDISKAFLNNLTNPVQIPYNIYKQRYYNELALKEFKPEEDAIVLKEVTIRDQKIIKDEHINQKLHGRVETIIRPDESDAEQTNMFYYLLSKVPGLTTTYGYLRYRGYAPVAMLNGARVSWSDILIMQPSQIDKIELLNRAERVRYGNTKRAIFAFYTKRGSSARFNTKPTTGILTKRIKGYSQHREFYAPKYYSIEDIQDKTPDYRNTLYWDPNLLTEKGKTELSFYTSDNLGNYVIFVEGISNNGHICLGRAAFTVSEYHSKLSNEK